MSSLESLVALSNVEASINTLSTGLMVVQCIFIVSGFFSNLGIIYVGLSKKTLRDSSFHLLLVNVSLAYLLMTAFCYTSFVYKLRVRLSKNTLELEHCRLASFLLVWWLGVALFSNGFLAMNRALSCYPLSAISMKLRSKKVTIALIVGAWLASFVIYICPAVIHAESWIYVYTCITTDHLTDNAIQAFLQGKELTIDNIVKLQPAQSVISWMIVGHLSLVLLVNISSYVLIVRYLLVQSRNVTSEQRKKEIRRALLIIMVLFCILLICWVPFLVAISIDPAIVGDNHVYFFLPAMEAAIDPVLYLIIMPAFRPQWLVKVIKKVKVRSSRVTHLTMDTVSSSVMTKTTTAL